jgi:hypothetical protein
MKHFISILIFLATLLVLSTWMVNGIQAQTNWEKYPGNPVLDVGPEPWDSTWVFYPEVFFDGAIYRMWYTQPWYRLCNLTGRDHLDKVERSGSERWTSGQLG